MRHVDEPCGCGADIEGQIGGLIDGEVGGVVAMAEGIENESVETCEKWPGFVGNGAQISAIGEGKKG